MRPDRAQALSVLVVDDQEVVRRGLLAFLEEEPDLEVVDAVAGGEEALECLGRLDSEESSRPAVSVLATPTSKSSR
jgi:DNA-binding NarL/FixJ family response regulator